jgi:hypothetical protein
MGVVVFAFAVGLVLALIGIRVIVALVRWFFDT